MTILDDESEVLTPGQVSRLVTSRRVEDFGHVHQHLVRFVVSNPLEELPPMPLAPPESRMEAPCGVLTGPGKGYFDICFWFQSIFV